MSSFLNGLDVRSLKFGFVTLNIAEIPKNILTLKGQLASISKPHLRYFLLKPKLWLRNQ